MTSWPVRRFAQVRPRGQFFEEARLPEAWRRGHRPRRELPGCSPKPRKCQMGASAPTNETSKADYTLRIAPVTVELAPDHILSTIGYNGTSPGPVLRMREGKPVTVDVINDTDTPELVHWHGMLIPSDVDGSGGEGTPPVPPRGRRRYQLTPPSGRLALVPLARHGRRTTCTAAPTPASSASSTSMRAMIPGNTTRSFFSRCATGSRSSPAAWKMTMMTATMAPSPRSPQS